MITKLLNRILKIFFSFLCIVMLVGFFIYAVRNYIKPEVIVTRSLNNNVLVKKYYFSGKVKPRNITEIRADENMQISSINVKTGQIVESGFKLITFEDADYSQFTLYENGDYSLPDKIYIHYVTEDKSIKEGDVIISYSLYNSNDDMYIESVIDREIYDKLLENNSVFYYWKNIERMQDLIKIESVKEFTDYIEIVFPLSNVSKEKIYVLDNVKLLAHSQNNYNIVVAKTAIVPIGEIKEDNYCYLYIVETEDSILGEEYYISQNRYKILAVGDSTVALAPDGKSNKEIDRSTMIVNYASAVLDNKMRVRVIY